MERMFPATDSQITHMVDYNRPNSNDNQSKQERNALCLSPTMNSQLRLTNLGKAVSGSLPLSHLAGSQQQDTFNKQDAVENTPRRINKETNTVANNRIRNMQSNAKQLTEALKQ